MIKLSGFAAALATETENLPGLYASMLAVRAAYVATMSTNRTLAAQYIAEAKAQVAQTRLPNQRKLYHILRAIGDVEVLTGRLLALGVRIHGHERYRVAIDVFDAVYEMAQDAQTRLSALHRRAFALRMMGRFTEACDAYCSLVREATKSKSKRMVLEGHLGHAYIHINRGNIPAASACLDTVWASAGKDRHIRGQTLFARSTIAGQTGDMHGAIRYGRAAMRKLGRADRGRCGLNVATAYRATGQHDKARKMAAWIRDYGLYADERGLALVLLSHLATDVGDYAELVSCHTALTTFTTPLMLVERQEAFGRALAATRDFAASRNAYEKMLDLAQQYKYGEPARRAEVALTHVHVGRVPPVDGYNPPSLMAVGRINAITRWRDESRAPIAGYSRRAQV